MIWSSLAPDDPGIWGTPRHAPKNIPFEHRFVASMDRILLERLGIGWRDSVAEANEKRMKDGPGGHATPETRGFGGWFYSKVLPPPS